MPIPVAVHTDKPKSQNWLDTINRENFSDSFNLRQILKGSVFYPASGLDGRAVKILSPYSRSIIQVDYSVTQAEVELALRNDFGQVGYDLVGLMNVPEASYLTPDGFTPHHFPLQASEVDRMHFLERASREGPRFAVWAVYELNPAHTHVITGKVDRFSVLHVGGEASATFDVLYVNSGINPLAVAILQPGEGYGDNWTRFTDPDYRLHQLILLNHQRNGAPLPEYLLTDDPDLACWPEYARIEYIEMALRGGYRSRMGLFQR